MSLLVFNDNFKALSNCDWNTWTSSRTSFNIIWFTASSVDVFLSEIFDWLGDFCTGERISVETVGKFGLTTDIFGVFAIM